MDSLLQDLRFALRALMAHRGYAAAALLTLAGGIGAVTAILSVVNGVILRPLPYPNAARALLVWTVGRDGTPEAGQQMPFSGANFVDLKAQNGSLEHAVAFRAWPMTWSGSGTAQLLNGAKVSAGFFEALGVSPFLGRTFTLADDQAGAEPVAILSHAIWRDRFGADPSVVGRQVQLNDVSYTVVGIMPPGFAFPRGGELPSGFRFALRTDIWSPMSFLPSQLQFRGMQNLAVLALPKQGVTRQATQADLALTMERIAVLNPATNENTSARVVGLLDGPKARVGPALMVLLGAVSFLLLLACANVVNLLLTRTLARSREVAVRSALGAPRGRILAQFLTENLVLSVLGGLLGVGLALVFKDAIMALAPEKLPRLDDVGLDWRAAGMIVGLVLLVGIVLGVASGSQIVAAQGIDDLRDGTRTSGSRASRRLRSGLVVIEVAISVVLLVGAGALGRTFVNLNKVEPGFARENVLVSTMIYPLFTNDFSDFVRRGPEWSRFYGRLQDEVSTLPGVRAAGVVSVLPLSGAWESTGFRIEGREPSAQGTFSFFAGVTDGYFAALGIPLLRGRLFDVTDRDSARAVILSAALAAKYWPGADPLGQQIRVFGNRPLEIVGIVGDVHQSDLAATPEPTLYMPMSVYPSPHMTLVVRANSDPAGLLPAIREKARAINPAVALNQPRLMDDVLGESLAQQRFSATLLVFFAIAALALAVLGLYGVISFGVARRSREIGVRLALGAAPSKVLGMVVKEGLALGVAGVTLGLLGAIAMGRALAGLVFGVSPTDPVTLIAVGALLAGVAAAASWLPARRAMRVDPAVVLRSE